jgi:acid phosphatase
MLSTVELNWGLPSLGRWDCNANVLALVANKTGYSNQKVDTTSLFFNASYPGPLSDAEYIPVWPVPTNGKCAAGSILSSVVSTWGTAGGSRNYTNVYPYDAASNNNFASSPSPSTSGGSTGTPTGTSSSPSATTSKPSAANMNMGFSWIVLLGLAGIVSFSMM